MAEVPDSEKIYPCQLVLLAMGFLGPEDSVFGQLKVCLYFLNIFCFENQKSAVCLLSIYRLTVMPEAM